MNSLPSPADSPQDGPSSSVPSSRKRQRSQSMQSNASESSASAKRPSSEPSPQDATNRTVKADGISTLSISDKPDDIDAYMDEQDHADATDALPVPKPVVPHASQKHPFIFKLKGESMKEGQTWYLVSRSWWRRWEKAVTAEVDKEGGVDEDELGPVDNRPLLDECANLRTQLTEGVDVEYIPEDAWNHFVLWYGNPAHPLPRRVILRGIYKQAALELYPPRLTAFLLTKPIATDQNAPVTRVIHVTISSQSSVKELREAIANPINPGYQTSCRLWKLSEVELPNQQLSYISFTSCKPELLEENDRTIEEAFVESGDVFAIEFKSPFGEWFVDANKLTKTSSMSTSSTPPPLFGGDGFFERMSNKNHASSLPSLSSTIKPFTSPNSSSARSRNIEPGTLGLGNMGNTCFMNSALQCLAHTKELSEYFLTGLYKNELNPDNPLGMHGAIAESFGALMHRMWDPSSSTSYSPREFKQVLQKFAPQFSGYQQHDSQELVAFLLDGLHEDLNRVLKKPYVEKPDWEGGGNIELVKLANASWEGYMKRNDSVIVDLFQGQYKSTLVCPECSKVSITFDPFMYLTLPLPINKKWRHSVYYVPWDVSKSHAKIPVELGVNASFKDLRLLLGRWMNVPADNILCLEVWNHKFYKSLHDNVQCSEATENDLIVCFELPCHAQQSRSYKKQETDPFIIPVSLSDLSAPPTRTFRSSQSGFGYPFIAVIDREQAKSTNAIYDAIVKRLERWTANARDLFTWEADGPVDGPIQPNDTAAPGDLVDEKGAVVMAAATPQESDIADEKRMDVDAATEISSEPRNVGTKKDIFHMRIQPDHSEYETGSFMTSNRFDTFEQRAKSSSSGELLLPTDGLLCQFDENMKAYYFGDESSKWEHALWEHWENFIHPEYERSQKGSSSRQRRGITLQDCLEEFVKEEQLGEDDLWYCPQCKEHRQATKKFDLWKAPDVLAVHLKRFSNSRTLRDKIDAFVDFPVSGLDLSEMVGERLVSADLLNEGIDLTELGLEGHNQSLVYDLFAVDEHLGGLGGGHYRAYAYNHVTNHWYHFDDSFVTKADATDAVNANAYLLFYRRRSDTPLGGKTHTKIQEAQLLANDDEMMKEDAQLPTPPSETVPSSSLSSPMKTLKSSSPEITDYRSNTDWFSRIQSSNKLNPLGPPSPPAEDDEDIPPYSSYQDDSIDDLVAPASSHFEFPEPSSSKASPSSSIEAEPDLDDLLDDSPEWPEPESAVLSRTDSPTDSNGSNPLSDANV